MKKLLSIGILLMSLSLAAAGQSTPGLTDGSQTKPLTLLIPNAFTPNGDGINDTYSIRSSNFAQFEFSVFDRWGNAIYETRNPDFEWNGQYSSGKTLQGVYVFVFKGITQQGLEVKRSGTISIIF